MKYLNKRLVRSIRSYMKVRRMSAKYVSVMSGVTHTTVRGFLAGRTQIGSSHLVEILKVLDINLCDIVEKADLNYTLSGLKSKADIKLPQGESYGYFGECSLGDPDNSDRGKR